MAMSQGKTVVTINVGGTKFTTLWTTLTEVFHESKVARHFIDTPKVTKKYFRDENTGLVGSRMEECELKDAFLFLDADPVMFAHILNVLRRPELLELSGYTPVGITGGDWDRELRYWGLRDDSYYELP